MHSLGQARRRRRPALRSGSLPANPARTLEQPELEPPRKPPAMKARVIVTLKAGVLDPQGKAIEGALRSLGVEGVAGVRQGKVFDLELEGDPATAEARIRAACEKLLANTVIENFEIEV
jgi:phosphoribosylformylglycinamidine synthase PurS subunit